VLRPAGATASALGPGEVLHELQPGEEGIEKKITSTVAFNFM